MCAFPKVKASSWALDAGAPPVVSVMRPLTSELVPESVHVGEPVVPAPGSLVVLQASVGATPACVPAITGAVTLKFLSTMTSPVPVLVWI